MPRKPARSASKSPGKGPARRRVFGYARVSSVEQTVGTSLQDQQTAIRGYAKGLGLDVTRMFVEAESAVHEKIERRAQIRALLSEIGPGDLVLCHRLDRWSRDPEFTYGSVRKILAQGARFFSVDERIDPSTPEGDSALGMFIYMAREEHKRIKRRMVGTRKILRDAGYYVEGLPPPGYKRAGGKGAEKNVLVIDEETAPKMRKAFSLAARGRSLSDIETAVGLEKSLVHKHLRSRTYLGEVKNSAGHWIAGKHAPLIDAHTFAAAIRSLEERRHGWNKAPDANAETFDWWLRDVARCALCESKMSAAYAGPERARRHYFACSHRCTRRYVPVRKAEQAAESIVLEHLRSLRAELSAPAPAPAESTTQIVDFESKLEALDKKREWLLEQNADGFLSRDELREKMAKLDTERTRIDALMVRPAPPVSPAARKRALLTVRDIEIGWRKLSGEERRELVRTLAKRCFLHADKAPRFEWMTADELAVEACEEE